MRSLLLLALFLALPAAATNAVGPAPGFQLPARGGKQVSLDQFKGQVVMINFWATWCGPCKQELPHLARLYDKYRSAGFVLLGVSVDDDPKAAQALAERMGLKFPVLFDTDKSVSRLYALDSMPSSVLIDRDGKLRHLHRGYRDGVEQLYERQVRDLVKE